MNESSLNQMIDTALGKIRSVADSNTVIGEPIKLNDEVVVLPFSKVSVGFAAGGADYDSKKQTTDKKNFAGGNGAGVSIIPLGFIIVKGTEVQVVDLKNPCPEQNDNPVAQALEGLQVIREKAPEIYSMFKSKKNKDETLPEEEPAVQE